MTKSKIKKIIGVLLAIHFAPLTYLVVGTFDPYPLKYGWYMTGMLANLCLVGIAAFGMLLFWLFDLD